ncbi:MAG: response regulator [Alphaproteobacteria bacterium]
MIVIASKTEIRLRDDLRKCAKLKPNQRCFFLEFSRTDIPKGPLFETFLRQLEEVTNAYMAKVYLCRDKDILIIMEGFMQRQFHGFIQKLAEELKTDDLTEIINIFEIGKNWDELEALYTKKINAINQLEEEQREEKRKNTAEQTTLEVLSKINPDQVANITQRRDKRTRPLVMIADDDQLSRTLAGNVLRGDYDMAFAKNGSEALQEFVAAAPDILFLDIGMPDIGGHEVLECLFQINPEAYIIMFSGRKDKTTIMKSLEIGAQGFLGKPFTREQLYTHVQNSPFVQNKQNTAA